jgi:hypothetical protein
MKNTIYRAVTRRSSEKQASASAGFLRGLVFDPEDGVDMLFRKVGISPYYTALKPRRPYPLWENENTSSFRNLMFFRGTGRWASPENLFFPNKFVFTISHDPVADTRDGLP